MTELKKIGQMDNTIDHTFESANRVYDKEGLCPTITTCSNAQPKIIQDFACVAMRGRNPERPTDRTSGLPTEQRLELNHSGTINTLTTVQKDNMILETVCCKLDKMPDGKLTSINNAKICDVNTPTASTITARYQKGIGSHKDNMVLEKKIQKVGQISNDGSQCGTVLSEEGLCSTLTAGTHGYANNHISVKQATKEGSVQCKVGGCFDGSYPDSKTRRGRVQNNGDVTPTITAQGGENINDIEEIINEEKKRIREVLCFLRSEIGEKSFSEWSIRGLYCFLKKEILQQKLYAEIVLKNWKESADLEQFTYNSKRNKSIITS